MNKFDKYFIIARLCPTFISMFPLLLLLLAILNFDDMLSYFVLLVQLGSFIIWLILIYPFTYFVRILGKKLETNIYNDELDMPTTIFLLHTDDTLSKEFKENIRHKINTDFNIILKNKASEQKNIINAKRLIIQAIGLIRNRVKNGHLLLQYNIEYGFIRNLIGGSFIAIPISTLSIIYFFLNEHSFMGWLNVIFIVFFSLLVFFLKSIVKFFGKLYAKRLFTEYMSEPKTERSPQ